MSCVVTHANIRSLFVLSKRQSAITRWRRRRRHDRSQAYQFQQQPGCNLQPYNGEGNGLVVTRHARARHGNILSIVAAAVEAAAEGAYI